MGVMVRWVGLSVLGQGLVGSDEIDVIGGGLASIVWDEEKESPEERFLE